MKKVKLAIVTLLSALSLGACSGGEQSSPATSVPTGSQGPQGEKGEKGDKGDKGDTGAQGEKGDKGDTGPQGEKGADGTSVLTGSGEPSDELGSVGDSYIDTSNWNIYVKTENGWGEPVGNIKGADGAKGDTGAQGEKGDKGDTGAAGQDGKDGADGKDGDTPYIGENGNWWIGQTDTGIKAAGADGQDGADGSDGQNGKDGIDGEDGADGKSAYDIAVENGFQGTEAEWLESLKGADGAQGQQGIQGDKGDTGEKGDKGDTGATGAKGDKGDKGETGAPGQDGKDGKDGADGKDGDTPYIGENGNWWIGQTDTGIKAAGTDGQNGNDGSDGEDGEDGKSAYQIAVENGFQGTEAEWIESLKGAKGDTGEKGDKGDQGEAGKSMVGFFVETISQLEAASKVENAYIIMMDTIVVDRDFTLDTSGVEINGRFRVEEGKTFSIVGDGTLYADDTSYLIDNKGTLSIGELGEDGPTLKLVSKDDQKSLGYNSSLIRSGSETDFEPNVYTAEFDLLSGSLVGGKNTLENNGDSKAYIKGGELNHTANKGAVGALVNLGEVIVSGGSISSTEYTALKCNKFTINNETYGGSAVVTGGFIKGYSAGYNVSATSPATISLQGGTYGYTNTGYIGKYVADGYTVYSGEDFAGVRQPTSEDYLLYYAKSNGANNPGTYTVAYLDEAERDDEVKYYLNDLPFGSDIQGVFCCLEDGQTVKLTHSEQNIAINKAVLKDKSFIIDLNGQTIGDHKYTSSYSAPLAFGAAGVSVKIVGEGKVLNNINKTDEVGSFISVGSTATLEIEGGSYAQDPSAYVNPLTHHVEFNEQTQLYDVLPGGVESISFYQVPYTLDLEGEDVSFSVIDNRGIVRETTVTSSDESVVSIVDGKLHPVALGEATLTASFDFAGAHFEAQANVIVKIALQSFSIEGDEVRTAYIGNQIQLVPTFSPNKEYVIDPALTWTSSNTNFATVDSEGKVTIKRDNGSVVITATNEATGLSDSVTFNVPRHGTVGEDPLTTTEFNAKYGTQEHFYVYGVASEVDVYMRGSIGYYARFKLTSGSDTMWVEEAEGFWVSNEEAALIQNGATIVIKCGIAQFGKYRCLDDVDLIFSITQPA